MIYSLEGLIEDHEISINKIDKELYILLNNIDIDYNKIFESLYFLIGYTINLIIIYPNLEYYDNVSLDEMFDIIKSINDIHNKDYNIEIDAFNYVIELVKKNNKNKNVIFIDSSNCYYGPIIDQIKILDEITELNFIIPDSITQTQYDNINELIKNGYIYKNTVNDYIYESLKKILYNEEVVKIYHNKSIDATTLDNSNIKNDVICIIINKVIHDNVKINIDSFIKNINYRSINNYTQYSLNRLISNSISNNNDTYDDSTQTLLGNYVKSSEIKMLSHKHKFKLLKRNIKNMKAIENTDINKDYELSNLIDNYIINIDENNEYFKQSIEQFNCFFSISDWFEELKNKNPIGIVANINTSYLGKLGVNYNVKYGDISNAFMSVDDYITIVLQYFDNNKCNGNINKSNMIEYNMVKYNTIIPLYLNDIHWKCTKKYIEVLLGIMFNHNPLGYVDTHYDMLFSLLVNYTYKLAYVDIYDNDKSIQTYISYLRTCIQVSIEKKYTRGIYKIINKYKTNMLVMNNMNEYVNILGQMICVRINNDDYTSVMFNMVTELFRYALQIYTKQIITTLFVNNNGEQYVFTQLDIILESIETVLTNHIKVLYSYTLISKALEKIYILNGSYNKFIKQLDSQYSIIDKQYVQIIRNAIIKSKPYTLEDYLVEILNISNDKVKSITYLNILQGVEFRSNKEKLYAAKNNKYIKYDDQLNMSLNDIYQHYFNKYNIFG